ncbi:putative transcription factor cmr1 protein [Phaeoacremonium minimum UCRPA7]|uniref:Putative transcription factor cmr1 protein n=1 Tax=Phaeoacremonium minimum (strain UCR-PA7) TaxID=1286976 RepID=R8BTS6_PHAM7|nr:putative transcription factor cmr1 protein [Phaeoacremonium minimum UCRPA7]EOO02704.1 putative transcription factor cmr1 protein [Phaeoacremonium minimum UCRPA7]
MDTLDEFMQLGGDFVATESSYQDLLVWPEYSLELDMYPQISNDNSIPEFEVVIASENAWPLARCNPLMYSGTCPRTAIVHLEALEQKCKQEGTWNSLEKFIEQFTGDGVEMPTVVPLTSRTRDKMLAITQTFLHKALDIHRASISGYPKTGYASPGDFSFIVLPPSNILEYFLRSYVRSLQDFYPLVFAGCVDPNEMLSNNQASTLLVLLMIAQGAASVPTAEARYLSAGLTETCRISLFDIIEKDVELSADPIALRCALLFTLLGAWSGDKWQMDIAMGQRGMYLSMLKHAGMLEPQPSMIPTFNNTTSTELQWRSWLHREAQNRLVYNWVMENPNCPVTRCNMVLYHLISLHAVTNFPEIERLARRENFDGSYWELSLRHKRCIYQREEAVFHCGQVFRLLRQMPADRRPAWWSAALYRATLILWTDSISRLDPNFQIQKREDHSPVTSNAVAVDQLTLEDPSVYAYLWHNNGVAVLTRMDGSTVDLDKPTEVLTFAIKTLDEAISTRIGDGIKRKLMTLGSNWSADILGAAAA